MSGVDYLHIDVTFEYFNFKEVNTILLVRMRLKSSLSHYLCYLEIV